MNLLFIEYPKCSTCQKAKKCLIQNKMDFIDRHIVEETPTKDELKEWIKRSELSIQKFFNTSGNLYKELHLKDKLPQMSDDEKLTLLSQHGMLIKRPLLVSDHDVLVGFKEESYQKMK